MRREDEGVPLRRLPGGEPLQPRLPVLFWSKGRNHGLRALMQGSADEPAGGCQRFLVLLQSIERGRTLEGGAAASWASASMPGESAGIHAASYS